MPTPDWRHRAEWIEREMDSLSDERFDTRTGLETPVDQSWERADPTCADLGCRPEHPPRLSVENEGFTAVLRHRARVEPDFGPDLEMGL